MVEALSSYAVEAIKRWVTYWRKFKGKRVRIWFKRGIKLKKSMDIPLSRTLDLPTGDSIEMNLLDIVEGTISDIIENPFGVMLKELSVEPKIEMMFIPMSEISRMDFL